MTDDNEDFEGFRIIEGGDATDDNVAPGRSVFGDDDITFDDDDDALPHWSEPATGTVPQVGGESEPPDAADETTFTPEQAPEFEPQAPVAETGQQPAVEPSGTEGVPVFEPAGAQPVDDDMAAWAEVSSTPRWADESELPPVEPVGEIPDAADDFFEFDDQQTAGDVEGEPPLGAALGGSSGAGRDLPAAVFVGVGLAALILAAMAVGPAAALVVVTLALGLGAVEWFNATRVAGHHPAVLLGLAAVVALPLAVYWRGEAAMPLVLVLSVVFGALWYLTGVGTESPLRGLGTTMLGIVYIGLLGSFAALMLSIPTVGTGLLTAAVLVTIAYDVGGLAIGKLMGRSPLSPASPNKTVEGLVGGCAIAVVVGLVIGVVGAPSPFGDGDLNGGLFPSLLLGLAAAVVAPIGDLFESVLKRDLGIKDMGSILPGHGGVLDRFDSLLFVLPTVYYLARMLDVGVPG